MTTTHTQPAGCDLDTFAAWLAREMPAGTVISDPAWWAPRIFRAAQAQQGDTRQGAAASAIIDHIADNWPMKKYSLEEIEDRLRSEFPATPAAHTCTPADERADTCLMCNDSGIVGFPPDQYEECPDCIKARAAPGAGTAPVEADADTLLCAARYRALRSGNDYANDNSPMVVLYEVGSDNGDRPYWSISGEVLDNKVDAMLATPPAPVSTAAAPMDSLTPASLGLLRKGLRDWETPENRYAAQRVLDAIEAATVSTAAATTASIKGDNNA